VIKNNTFNFSPEGEGKKLKKRDLPDRLPVITRPSKPQQSKLEHGGQYISGFAPNLTDQPPIYIKPSDFSFPLVKKSTERKLKARSLKTGKTDLSFPPIGNSLTLRNLKQRARLQQDTSNNIPKPSATK
jgi:hypothetical protein